MNGSLFPQPKQPGSTFPVVPFPQEPAPPSPPRRPTFWGLSRIIAKFGLLISAVVFLSFLARLIPAFTVPFLLLYVLAILALIAWSIFSHPDDRVFAFLVILALLTGGALAFWDAAIAILQGGLFLHQIALIFAVWLLAFGLFKVFFGGSSKEPKAVQPQQGQQSSWSDFYQAFHQHQAQDDEDIADPWQ